MVKRPRREDVRVFRDADTFGDWLEQHHATEVELWVGFYRKAVPKQSIAYPEAVDQGLCFGWIDGITYRVDDELYAVRFTPRTTRSNWSAVNIRRVGELTAAGHMRASGTAAFESRTPDRMGTYSYENRPAELPADYGARLRAEKRAWAWWQAQTASYRRAATWWVVSAKQEATRDRRMQQLIDDCAAGRRIKLLSYNRKTISET